MSKSVALEKWLKELDRRDAKLDRDGISLPALMKQSAAVPDLVRLVRAAQSLADAEHEGLAFHRVAALTEWDAAVSSVTDK